MTEAQFEHLAVAGLKAVDGVAHLGAHVRPVLARRHVGRVVGHVLGGREGHQRLPRRNRCRHSLRATAYSQGRSRAGSRSLDTLAAAMTKVSCTTSAARPAGAVS